MPAYTIGAVCPGILSGKLLLQVCARSAAFLAVIWSSGV
jgi:hypothetical protein